MKIPILFFTMTLILCFPACGQPGKIIPSDVKSSFLERFPKAADVKWGRENDNEWEAEFRNDGKKYSANFDNDGSWIETEYSISLNELPASVKTTLDKEAAGAKIRLSEVSETIDGIVYEFITGKGDNKTTLTINNEGVVIKKEKAEEEDNND